MKKTKTRFLIYFSVKKNALRKKYLFLHIKKNKLCGLTVKNQG